MSSRGPEKSSRRILIESSYTIERRTFRRGKHRLQSQPDYLILHLFRSSFEGVPAGACLLGNPNQALEPGSSRRRSEALLIRLSPELLIEKAARLKLYRTGADLRFNQSRVDADERLKGLIEQLDIEFESQATGWREMIGSVVDQLAVHLLRNYINVRRSEEIELSRVGIVDRRLRRAIEFMHDNCGRDLSLAEIAAQAYLSEFHFSRLFKKITGSSPHAYLAMLRIERARRLLVETDQPIAEVGALVGYPAQSHFTKIFREMTGLTPLAFRRAAGPPGLSGGEVN
ncbi:MAG: helix-turn-helix domain-containing protein [Acidobacteriota bacterium]|nr:MAG: helix-turn-helix domain-containing protein [Acidobacteriota bacterium]